MADHKLGFTPGSQLLCVKVVAGIRCHFISFGDGVISTKNVWFFEVIV